jgi:schlafen family protein
MPLVKVRYRRDEEFLEVEGLGRIVSTDAGLVATREVLEPAGLTSLQAALRRYEYFWGAPDGVYVTDEDEAHIDDETQLDPTSLVFRDGHLMAQTFAAMAQEMPDEQLLRSLVAAIVERERMTIVRIRLVEEKWGWGAWLTLEVPIRGKTAGEALHGADAVREMIEVGHAQEFDLGSAASVISAGHPELLVGLLENGWLEAKRAPYRLDHEVDRYELAKDVASFANATGGLILIGAKTKGRPEGDEITNVNGCVLADARPGKLRSLIEKRVHPRIEGLRAEQVPLSSDGRGVVLIEIPSQADSRKPFLVVGTRSGDRVSELGFTYAVREGDRTRAPRIEVVHQLIRAGHAALESNQASAVVEEIRADIDRLEAATWEGWLRDIVPAAVAGGFDVEREGEWVVFRKGDGRPLKIQATSVGPPADMLQRQRLLEQLGEMGLPVRTNPKGFLVLGDHSAS